jgi:hypothetical protein
MLFGMITMYLVIVSIIYRRYILLAFCPVFFALALMSKVTIVSFVVMIPIVMILLTEATLFATVLVYILMVIPTLFIVNYGSTYEKATLFLSIGIGLVSFYGAAPRYGNEGNRELQTNGQIGIFIHVT